MSESEIQQLRERINHLEAVIMRVASTMHDVPDREVPAAVEASVEQEADQFDEHDGASSRRGLLRAAAAAAGAAVVATTVSSGTASAADLALGTSNTDANPTRIDYTGFSASAGFLFQSGSTWTPTSPPFAGYPSALAGATSRGVQPTGVLGYTEVNPGTGVMAIAAGSSGEGLRAVGPRGLVASATAAMGTAVEATAIGGYGVRGISNTGVGVVGNSTDSIGMFGAGTTGVRGEGGTSGVHGQGLGYGVGVNGNAVGDGDGVHGTSAAGVGVRGTSTSDNAVVGETHSATHAAVLGFGAGMGVAGTTDDPTSGVGVAGFGRIGVRGMGGAYAFHVETADTAAMLLSATPSTSGPGRAAPPARSDAHVAGELDLDVNGDLWLCTGAGSPGTWRKIAGPTTAGAFHALAPGRVYDSRVTVPGPASPLAAGQERTVSVRDRRSTVDGVVALADFVPAGATAIAANVTVVNTVGAGFLTANPAGVHEINAATINWSATGQILNNGVILTLDAARELNVIAGGGASASTDFVIDVTGYYR